MPTHYQSKTPRGVKVAPQSKDSIKKLAKAVRLKLFETDKEKSLDLVHQLEFTLSKLGLDWEIAQMHEMPKIEAATSPDQVRMVIREDIYDALHNQFDPMHTRARFTIAHEFGHLLMHEGVALARHSSSSHKFYEDSEWQADAFAAELLMPSDGCIGLSAEQIKSRFGVSLAAAQAKYNALNK